MTESLFALLGTIFAGAGLKFFDWLVNRKTEQRIREEKAREHEEKFEQGSLQDRKEQILELRNELAELRRLIDEKEAEMLQWREKYWDLREQQVKTIVNLTEALDKIRELTRNGNPQN